MGNASFFLKIQAFMPAVCRHPPSTPVLRAAPTAVSSVLSHCCCSHTPEKPSHIFSKSHPDTPARLLWFQTGRHLRSHVRFVPPPHPAQASPSTRKDRVFAIRPASVWSASAASSTVAEETGNSRIWSSILYVFKYAFVLSSDIAQTSLSAEEVSFLLLLPALYCVTLSQSIILLFPRIVQNFQLFKKISKKGLLFFESLL